MAVELASFYRTTRTARKVLVVDLGFLGDSVHLVPALWEIKRHYAEAPLHTISAAVGQEVLALARCVDRAWVFPLGPSSPAWWRHWDVIWALRRERFDLVFNFGGGDRPIFVSALTGARWRVAHLAGRDHFWKTWLIRHWVPRQSRELPVFEQRRQVLAVCGFELAPPRFDLTVPTAMQQWAADRVPLGAFHFSINASTSLKEWPLPNWIQLARDLLRSHAEARIVATGSSQGRERDRLTQLAAAVNDPRLIVLDAGLSIAQLAATLMRCRAHVGADSGVLHLAMAVGTPTVSIFRQYQGMEEWLPPGNKHLHLSVPCPCAEQGNPPCQALGVAKCLETISPATVAARLQNHHAFSDFPR